MKRRYLVTVEVFVETNGAKKREIVKALYDDPPFVQIDCLAGNYPSHRSGEVIDIVEVPLEKARPVKL